PRHRLRIAGEVERLRAAGVTVTTLAQADDAVIQPEDGIIGSIDPSLIYAAPSTLDASPVARYLGHGRILHEPRVWRRLLAVIGPQTPGTAPAAAGAGAAPALVTPPPGGAAPAESAPERSGALLDRQLAELKERLRAEGR